MFIKLFIMTIILILIACACGQLIYSLTKKKGEE